MYTQFPNIQNILVIKLRHIGDVLLTIPVFRALHETFPQAQITAIVNDGTEEVLANNPLINNILCIRRGSESKISRIVGNVRGLNMLWNIKRMGFDMTVDLTGGDRAALLSLASGANYRIGWKDSRGFKGKKHCYTHLIRPDVNKHMVLQNYEVINAQGITTGNLGVDFFFPENDRTYVDQIFKQYNIKSNRMPVIHVHPSSRWFFKCWKDEYMADVIEWLTNQKVTVIITASADGREMAKIDSILSHVSRHENVVDLSGATTIKQLGSISQRSDLFIGVDSAPMHIAAAVGTPVIALFGPSKAHNWGPWDNFALPNVTAPYSQQSEIQSFGIHTVIQKKWGCIPCGRDGCDGSKVSRCLVELRPEVVKAILHEKLKNIRFTKS